MAAHSVDLTSFPLHGWRADGSFSYGQDELYGGIHHVMVRIFRTDERSTAVLTQRILEAEGVTTARLAEVRHVDENTYVYVFAEQSEFTSFCKRLDINVESSSPRTES